MMSCGVPSRRGARTSDALMLEITVPSQVIKPKNVDEAGTERTREAMDRHRRSDMAVVCEHEYPSGPTRDRASLL